MLDHSIPDEPPDACELIELAKALRLLAHSLPNAELRVRAAAGAWSPERAAGFGALVHALDLLRDEHGRIADELDSGFLLLSV